MAKSKGNKAVLNTGDEKIVTKYDKKVAKREKEAREEARNKKIFKFVSSAILIAIVAAIVIVSVSAYNRINKKYIVVDNEPVNQIEFDFYYNIAKNNSLGQTLYEDVTYGDYFVSYLGYNTSISDKSQLYDKTNGYTWFDLFANTALDNIKEYKALLKAADEKNFEYNKADEDYEEFKKDLEEAAGEAGQSVKEYYKTVFGKYASEAKLKTYVLEYLKAVAYQESLRIQLASKTEDVRSYYEEHKDDYDTVTYRALGIAAQKKSDADSLAEAKKKADEMAALVSSEDKFVELAKTYTTDEDNSAYDDKDKTLVKEDLKANISEAAGKWIYDKDRNKGDVTVIEDSANSQCIVIYFISRDYDEDCEETISNQLLQENYTEFIKPYIEAITVEDDASRVKIME